MYWEYKKVLSHLPEKEIWRSVILSRLDTKRKVYQSMSYDPGTKPLTNKQIDEIVEGLDKKLDSFKNFEEVIDFIIELDKQEGQFDVPPILSNIIYELDIKLHYGDKSINHQTINSNDFIGDNSKTKTSDDNIATGNYKKTIDANSDFVSNTTKIKLSDFQRPVEDFNIAVKNNPADAYYNRGTIKVKYGDYRGAIEDFDRVIELQLSYAMAYHNRGIAKLELGDQNGARLDWNKALDLGMREAYDLIKRYCK
jgi:tetratricopeptide (TPR) repeat protein